MWTVTKFEKAYVRLLTVGKRAVARVSLHWQGRRSFIDKASTTPRRPSLYRSSINSCYESVTCVRLCCESSRQVLSCGNGTAFMRSLTSRPHGLRRTWQPWRHQPLRPRPALKTQVMLRLDHGKFGLWSRYVCVMLRLCTAYCIGANFPGAMDVNGKAQIRQNPPYKIMLFWHIYPSCRCMYRWHVFIRVGRIIFFLTGDVYRVCMGFSWFK